MDIISLHLTVLMGLYYFYFYKGVFNSINHKKKKKIDETNESHLNL